MPRSMPRPRLAQPLAAALLAMAAIGPAAAVTITVDSTADVAAVDSACTLREAIAAANGDIAVDTCAAGSGADHIRFAAATPATITLAADLPAITAPVAIRGPGATPASLLTIDGATASRPLCFDSPGDHLDLAIVSDLRIYRGASSNDCSGDLSDDGVGGGAFVGAGDHVRFERVFFDANVAELGGGGIGSEGGTVEIVDSYFRENIANQFLGGGGVLSEQGALTITGSTFDGNSAPSANASGGGVNASRSVLSVARSTFSANSVGGSGGGIAVSGVGDVVAAIVDTTLAQNVAAFNASPAGEGGGLYAAADATLHLTLRNTILDGNVDGAAPSNTEVYIGAGTLDVTTGFDFVSRPGNMLALFPPGQPNANGDYVGLEPGVGAALDAELGALAQNGGLVPNRLPATTSLVVDHGRCDGATADQRGFADAASGLRPVDRGDVADGDGSDGCDIGAVEVDASLGSRLFADGFEAGHALPWTRTLP